MKWHFMLLYHLANAVKIFLCLRLVPVMTLKRPESMKKTALLSLAISIPVTAISGMNLFPLYQIAIEAILLLIVVRILFHAETRMSLFFIFIYEIAVVLGEFLCSTGMGVLFHSERFIDANALEHACSIWLLRFLMIGVAIFIRRKQDIGHEGASRLASFVALAGFLGVVALTEQTVVILNEDVVDTWLILSIVLLMAVLVFNLNHQYEIEKEIAKLKTEQAELLERDYQSLNNAYSANAKLFHDLHNHMEMMHRYLMQGKTAEAIRYLDDMRTPIEEITQAVWTGDDAMDYLVSSKISLAEQAHVETKVNIEFPRNTDIKSADLSAILGNLLDNALEASSHAAGNLRFLTLTIRRINSMLIIKVENGCGEAPTVKHVELQTSKPNNGLHGWGLKSVRAAAEKYDGTLETAYKDNVFQAVTILSYNAVRTK